MGRGRKPIPDIVKLERGTLEARKLMDVAKCDQCVPECPFESGTVAESKWNEVTAGLLRLGLIDSIDGTMVEAFCKNYQRATEADAIVDRDGIVLTNVQGNPVKNPACTVAADAWGKVKSLGADLGLTWLSRQRMSTGRKPEPEKQETRYLA